jgi:hypothetical protein
VKNLVYSVVGIVLGTALTMYFFGSMIYDLGTHAVTTADDETSIRRTLAECKLANPDKSDNSSHNYNSSGSDFVKNCMEAKGFKYDFYGLKKCPAESFDQAFMPECYRSYRTLSAEMNNPGVGALVAGEFTFAEMNAEVGCNSKDNEVRNRVVFDRKYYGREVTWQGQVESISTKGIRVVFNRTKTHSIDFEIEFLNDRI